MKKTLTALALIVPAPLFAGSIAAPVQEPVVSTPAPVAAPVNLGGDWTGGYAGLNFGKMNATAEPGDFEGDDTFYGAHVGYDYDFGRFVVGGELDYSKTDLDIAGETIDNVTRLKLRTGYDLGRTMIYATAGGAKADTSIGDADGWLGGVGVEYMATDSISVGGEVLHHRFDDAADSGLDLEANTVALRASFRF